MTGRTAGPGKNHRLIEAQVLGGIDAHRDRADAWVPRVTMDYLAPQGFAAQSRWLEVRRPAPPGLRWSLRGDKWVLNTPA